MAARERRGLRQSPSSRFGGVTGPARGRSPVLWARRRCPEALAARKRWLARNFRVRDCSCTPGEWRHQHLSRRKDPGVGRERRDGAGGWVRCGCGSAVSGRVLPGSGARSGPATAAKKEDAGRGRARVCGIGAAWAVLHIRPGPAGGGSAESCGNAPVFNVVGILPCAEGPALHMGARPLETDVLVRTPESQGKARTGPRGRRPPMCSTPARAGKNRNRRAGARRGNSTPARVGKNPTRPAAARRGHWPPEEEAPGAAPVARAPSGACPGPP